jgi:hypothetical protein
VGEVAIHLEDQFRSVLQCATEAGQVGRAEALLALAVQNGDEGELGPKPVGNLAGAVGRVVVDHEHAHAEWFERAEHCFEVLALVVSR